MLRRSFVVIAAFAISSSYACFGGLGGGGGGCCAPSAPACGNPCGGGGGIAPAPAYGGGGGGYAQAPPAPVGVPFGGPVGGFPPPPPPALPSLSLPTGNSYGGIQQPAPIQPIPLFGQPSGGSYASGGNGGGFGGQQVGVGSSYANPTAGGGQYAPQVVAPQATVYQPTLTGTNYIQTAPVVGTPSIATNTYSEGPGVTGQVQTSVIAAPSNPIGDTATYSEHPQTITSVVTEQIQEPNGGVGGDYKGVLSHKQTQTNTQGNYDGNGGYNYDDDEAYGRNQAGGGSRSQVATGPTGGSVQPTQVAVATGPTSVAGPSVTKTTVQTTGSGVASNEWNDGLGSSVPATSGGSSSSGSVAPSSPKAGGLDFNSVNELPKTPTVATQTIAPFAPSTQTKTQTTVVETAGSDYDSLDEDRPEVPAPAPATSFNAGATSAPVPAPVPATQTQVEQEIVEPEQDGFDYGGEYEDEETDGKDPNPTLAVNSEVETTDGPNYNGANKAAGTLQLQSNPISQERIERLYQQTYHRLL